MTFAPIILFAYDRPQHLKKTIASLKTNAEAGQSILYVFCDGPKTSDEKEKTEEIAHLIESVEGFEKVIFKPRARNAGLATSIIEGVTEVLSRHSACIVLEDDLEVSPWFLQFMNQGLDHYREHRDIFSIAGYCPPIAIPADYTHEAFRFPRINAWGWATWADRWHNVDWKVRDFDSFIRDKKAISQLEKIGQDLPVMLLKQQTGEISSWAVRFNQACFRSGLTNIYPVRSLVRNLGADGTGTHMKASHKFMVRMTQGPLSPLTGQSHPLISRAFRRFYKPSVYRRLLNWIKIRNYLLNNPE
jgi:glycosyltransferase involved in cell wall biosynthesis